MWKLRQGLLRAFWNHWNSNPNRAVQPGSLPKLDNESGNDRGQSASKCDQIVRNGIGCQWFWSSDGGEAAAPSASSCKFELCHWKEWMRSFHSNFYFGSHQPHSFIEALGWGTALLLGLQLSHFWSEEHRKLRSRIPESANCPIQKAWQLCRYAGLTSFENGDFLAKKIVEGTTSLERAEASVRQKNLGAQTLKFGSQRRTSLPSDTSLSLLVDDCSVKNFGVDGSFLKKSCTLEGSSATANKWNLSVDEVDSKDLNKKRIAADTFDEVGLVVDGTKSAGDEFSQAEPTFDAFAAARDEWNSLCILYENMCCNMEAIRLSKEGQHLRALALWQKAGDRGYAKALYNLGVAHETGAGISVDVDKAIVYYELAAESGYVKAMYNMAMLLLNKDNEEKVAGMCWLERAADIGLREAKTKLGVILAKSENHQNFKRAAKLFADSAHQRDPEAQYYMGICYEQGWGVERNECQAADMYWEASNAGHTGATFNLAVFFECGLGGLPEDKAAARKLYEKAAEAGDCCAKERVTFLGAYNDDSTKSIAKEYLPTKKSSPNSANPGSSFASRFTNHLSELAYDDGRLSTSELPTVSTIADAKKTITSPIKSSSKPVSKFFLGDSSSSEDEEDEESINGGSLFDLPSSLSMTVTRLVENSKSLVAKNDDLWSKGDWSISNKLAFLNPSPNTDGRNFVRFSVGNFDSFLAVLNDRQLAFSQQSSMIDMHRSRSLV